MASVVIVIPNSGWAEGPAVIRWDGGEGNYINLGSSLSADGSTIYFGRFELPRGTGTTMTILLSSSQTADDLGAGPEFSTTMEMSGTITLVASNSATVATGIGDSTEPYNWTPANLSAVRTFADILEGLPDRSLTVTFDDNTGVSNSPPTITAINANPSTVDEGGVVTLTATVTDPDI